jgi:hypothetical protein
MTYDRLINGYVQHSVAVAHETANASFWAYEGLHGLVEQNPEAAWAVVLDVIARVPDDACLEYVAADVLEDLLCDHGVVLIDRVEARAASDERFSRAVARVWGRNRMEPGVRKRLDDLVGTVKGGTQ